MGEFGESLLKARRRLKITQTTLAEKTGLTHAMIALLEGGKSGTSLETAGRLTYALLQQALPEGCKLLEIARVGEEPDGRYIYEMVVMRKGTARHRLPVKGLAPLAATKTLYRGRAEELRMMADVLEAALKALEGDLAKQLTQEALPVPAQIAKRIQGEFG